MDLGHVRIHRNAHRALLLRSHNRGHYIPGRHPFRHLGHRSARGRNRCATATSRAKVESYRGQEIEKLRFVDRFVLSLLPVLGQLARLLLQLDK